MMASRALTALIVAASLMSVPTGALAAASTSACEPDVTKTTKALNLRNSGQLADAETLLRQVLAAHPHDYRATYLLGTVLGQKSDAASQAEALTLLLDTEHNLRAQSVDCINNYGWRSIYTSLGVFYFRSGNINKSQMYLDKALSMKDSLYPSTRVDLYDTLAAIATRKGDFKLAAQYFNEASKSGDSQALVRAKTLDRLAGQIAKVPGTTFKH